MSRGEINKMPLIFSSLSCHCGMATPRGVGSDVSIKSEFCNAANVKLHRGKLLFSNGALTVLNLFEKKFGRFYGFFFFSVLDDLWDNGSCAKILKRNIHM